MTRPIRGSWSAGSISRVQSTRTLTRDGSQYFGPYGSVMMQHSVLDFIREVVPLRTCKSSTSTPGRSPGANTRSACNTTSGTAGAPASDGSPRRSTDGCWRWSFPVLKGDLRPVRQYLEGGDGAGCRGLKFELAQRYKQRLDALDNYAGKSVIVSAKIVDVDVFSLLPDDDVAWCNFVRIRHGSIVASRR